MKRLKYGLLKFADVTALTFLDPAIRLAFGEEPAVQARRLVHLVVVPVVAFAAFCGLWWIVARGITTKSGNVPTPAVVWSTAGEMWQSHLAARRREADFYATRDGRVAELTARRAGLVTPEYAATVAGLEADIARLEPTGSRRVPGKRAVLESLLSQGQTLDRQIAEAATSRYAGAPTYVDQIVTSLQTVFFGFAIATLIAVPLGILCGVSPTFNSALTPLISLFRPVSPIVWLPICGIIVGAYVDADDGYLRPAFISSAITVAVCSLWPTLVNTALGVASVEKDHLNVARVLRLGFWTRLTKIIIPSALPLIFTGLRISLGVGWMVLIAAELLATNPGLGKFVWDTFQNGSSQSFAQMFVSVFTVGLIGLLLDRVMIVFQRAVTFDVGSTAAAL